MPLSIVVKPFELFDEHSNKFVKVDKPTKLLLECSLIAISKWESKWHKPYLVEGRKTYQESISFVECMTLTNNVDPIIYRGLTKENMDEIQKYIDDPMTATVITPSKPKRRDSSFITSEVIYYAMLNHGIPFECQKWHIRRLLTLIDVCNEYRTPKEKRSQADILADMERMNNERKRKWGTRG